jgi:hypothetical protein
MFSKERIRRTLVDVIREAYELHEFNVSVGMGDYTYFRGKERVLAILAHRLGYTDEEIDEMIEEAKEPKREDEVQA